MSADIRKKFRIVFDRFPIPTDSTLTVFVFVSEKKIRIHFWIREFPDSSDRNYPNPKNGLDGRNLSEPVSTLHKGKGSLKNKSTYNNSGDQT
mgnify:CR=1 FL=1